jgi:hypothetical protein
VQLTPEQIEKLRAIGLRLDRGGTFWHDGAAVTHARLRQALLGWLDVRDDGRDIVRLDDRRYAYVEIEDAHLRARSARWAPRHDAEPSRQPAGGLDERCFVLWDDDRERELEYATLRQAPDHALYARVGRLRGRIASPAYHAIAERIVMVDGGFALVAAGRRWPIADAA